MFWNIQRINHWLKGKAGDLEEVLTFQQIHLTEKRAFQSCPLLVISWCELMSFLPSVFQLHWTITSYTILLVCYLSTDKMVHSLGPPPWFLSHSHAWQVSDIVRPMIANVHQAPITPKITLLLSSSFQNPWWVSSSYDHFSYQLFWLVLHQNQAQMQGFSQTKGREIDGKGRQTVKRAYCCCEWLRKCGQQG